MPFYKLISAAVTPISLQTPPPPPLVAHVVVESSPYDHKSTFLHTLKNKPGQVLLDKQSGLSSLMPGGITITARDIATTPNEKAMLGDKKFSLSSAGAESLKKGGRIFLSERFPKEFYLGLVEAMSAYKTETEMSAIMYKSLQEIANEGKKENKKLLEFIENVKQHPEKYGFTTEKHKYLEPLLNQPLTLIIATNVVLTQPTVVIVDSKNRLTDKPIAYVVSSASGLDLQTTETCQRFFSGKKYEPKEFLPGKDIELKKMFSQILTAELDALKKQGVTDLSMLARGIGAFIELIKIPPGQDENNQTLQKLYTLYMESLFEVALDPKYSDMNLYFSYKPVPLNIVDKVANKYVDRLAERKGTFVIHDKDAAEIAERLAEQGNITAKQNASDSKPLVNPRKNILGMHWKDVKSSDPATKSSKYVGEEQDFARHSLALVDETALKKRENILTSQSDPVKCTNELETTLVAVTGKPVTKLTTVAATTTSTSSASSQPRIKREETAPSATPSAISSQQTGGISREGFPEASASANPPGRPKSIAMQEVTSKSNEGELAEKFKEKNPEVAKNIDAVIAMIVANNKKGYNEKAISHVHSLMQLNDAELTSKELTGIKEYYRRAMTTQLTLAKAELQSPQQVTTSKPITQPIAVPVAENTQAALASTAPIAQSPQQSSTSLEKQQQNFERIRLAVAWGKNNPITAKAIDDRLAKIVEQATQAFQSNKTDSDGKQKVSILLVNTLNSSTMNSLKVEFEDNKQALAYIDYKYAKLQNAQNKPRSTQIANEVPTPPSPQHKA